MIMDILNMFISAEFWYAVLRISTPIIFATMGAMISTKAGVLNIALEGIMLMSALLGVVFSSFIPSVWVALLATLCMSSFFGFLLGYLSIKLQSDIILTGIAFNMAATGGSVFILFLLTGQKGVSTALASQVIPRIDIPLIKSIPFLGQVLSGHNILTYVSFLAVFLIFILVYKTPLGLHIRAVGENSDAAESVGINVRRTQYIALTISGTLCGLGGAFMSMGYLSWFGSGMTAGRGFIALAADSMGGGTPLGGLLVALFFGFATSISNQAQVIASIKIPREFIQMFPYIATILGIVIYSIQKRRKLAKKLL